jgi:ribosomal protein L21E
MSKKLDHSIAKWDKVKTNDGKTGTVVRHKEEGFVEVRVPGEGIISKFIGNLTKILGG